MSELDFEVAELPMPSAEIIDLTIDSSEENEVTKIGAGLEQKSTEIISDLEEGEIKEPDNTVSHNPAVCRYFHRGKCWLGKNCSFLHVGINSYKMFNDPPVIVYQPVISNQSMEDPPDAWDKGLKEAKILLLNAKRKKETDLDFEEKQLYQGLDEIIKDNEDFYRRKMNLADRHKKRKEACPDCSRLKNSERGPKTLKTVSKGLPCSRKSETVKLRTRKSRSKSWSPVLSRRSYSLNSSSSSVCRSCEASSRGCHESENDVRKSKSKLERVFSRTFDAPEKSRSRKQTASRHTHSSHLRRRSSSRHSYRKRFLYRSYSKSASPLKKEYSKKRPGKNVPHKPLHKRSSSPNLVRRKKCSSPYSKKERTSSPFSKFLSLSNARDLASCSSDMTISSIKCTSVSTSYEEIETTRPSKSPTTVSSRKSKIMEDTHKHVNSYDVDTCLDTAPKSTKRSKRASKIPTKRSEKFNKGKDQNSKPVENGKTIAELDRKLSSDNSTSDEELSADELELLRYVPNKNRKKVEQEKKGENKVKAATSVPKTPVKSISPNEENHSVKTNVKYPPPKIIYDYGSDETECLLSKLINDYGSDRLSSSQKSVGSNTESPIPRTPVENILPEKELEHVTNGEKDFPVESNNVERVNDTVSDKLDDTAGAKCPSATEIDDAEEDIPKQFDKNSMEQNNNSPPLNTSRKRRSSGSSTELSEAELELLKYVSIGHPNVSEKIRQQSKKNPPDLSANKAKPKSKSKSVSNKSPESKSAGQKEVKSTQISRKEHLLQQLKAVELAIAKRKREGKTASAKLRKKGKS